MTHKTRVAGLLRASAHVMALGASIGFAQPAAAAAASQAPDALAPNVTQSPASMVADALIVSARRSDETLTAVTVANTSEERRVWEDGLSPCIPRWTPETKKNKRNN